MRNTLLVAEETKLARMVPGISMYTRIPPMKRFRILVRSAKETGRKLQYVQEVRFVVLDDELFRLFSNEIQNAQNEWSLGTRVTRFLGGVVQHFSYQRNKPPERWTVRVTESSRTTLSPVEIRVNQRLPRVIPVYTNLVSTGFRFWREKQHAVLKLRSLGLVDG